MRAMRAMRAMRGAHQGDMGDTGDGTEGGQEGKGGGGKRGEEGEGKLLGRGGRTSKALQEVLADLKSVFAMFEKTSLPQFSKMSLHT